MTAKYSTTDSDSKGRAEGAESVSEDPLGSPAHDVTYDRSECLKTRRPREYEETARGIPIRQFDIVLFDPGRVSFFEKNDIRPAVVVSNPSPTPFSETMMLAIISSSFESIVETDVFLPADDLDILCDSVVRCNDIISVDTDNIISVKQSLPDPYRTSVKQSLSTALGITADDLQ